MQTMRCYIYFHYFILIPCSIEVFLLEGILNLSTVTTFSYRRMFLIL